MEQMVQEDKEDKREPPLWVANGVLFILMFVAVCSYFLWQMHLVKESFRFHADRHAEIVSKIVGLNAAATTEAKRSIESIIQNLLENSARFIAYLDMVEPFTSEELEAFTKESGLAGISIIRGCIGLEQDDSLEKNGKNFKPYLKHFADSNIYLLIWSADDYPDCIALGISDEKIASITKSLGLDNIIKEVATVQGIKRVKVDGAKIGVEVDSSELTQSIEQLKLHFYLFSVFLIVAGVILSFLLHRYQNATINRIKEFERQLASERENATLGKSAAAIAHEIRNPLNSLSMGLQRLILENGCQSEPHIKLIKQMSEAVKRANMSVTGLLNYARPRVAKVRLFEIETLTVDILNLYKKRCEDQKIEITLDIDYHDTIKSDPELMGQVIENIIKNSVEAQPDGGFISISITKNWFQNFDKNHLKLKSDVQYLLLRFKNAKCPVKPENSDKIFEPYFTTRPEGTGLGMAIVRNIVTALGGKITVAISESREIETSIYLPL
ncbi:MAG: hypothetical protein HQK68_10665 [Desulfamplus sp.]|nr:hypothetical protein [Desulfamplus sp.]